MIKEGIMVITLRRSMLALLQIFCFYLDVSLKCAQSQKCQEKKKYHSNVFTFNLSTCEGLR